MTMYYSPSTLGFYDEGHGGLPEDVISVEMSDYQAMVEGQAAGQQIAFSKGKLKLVTPAPTAVDLSAYTAAKRYAVETGGITVNGSTIATDRESQAMITGAWNYVQASAASSVSYKAGTGFVTLDADAIKSLALAVGAHVQACFAKESDVQAGIKDGSVKTTADIDAAFAALTA